MKKYTTLTRSLRELLNENFPPEAKFVAITGSKLTWDDSDWEYNMGMQHHDYVSEAEFIKLCQTKSWIKIKEDNMLKRVLENQLHLHDEGNPAWGASASNYKKAPKNLAEILRGVADKYTSPQKEIIKNKMDTAAINGKYQITVKKRELDSSTELWLKEEGITLTERWSGNQIDGETVVDLKW